MCRGARFRVASCCTLLWLPQCSMTCTPHAKARFSSERMDRRVRTASSVYSSGCTPSTTMRSMSSAARVSSLVRAQMASSELKVTDRGVQHEHEIRDGRMCAHQRVEDTQCAPPLPNPAHPSQWTSQTPSPSCSAAERLTSSEEGWPRPGRGPVQHTPPRPAARRGAGHVSGAATGSSSVPAPVLTVSWPSEKSSLKIPAARSGLELHALTSAVAATTSGLMPRSASAASSAIASRALFCRPRSRMRRVDAAKTSTSVACCSVAVAATRAGRRCRCQCRFDGGACRGRKHCFLQLQTMSRVESSIVERMVATQLFLWRLVRELSERNRLQRFCPYQLV